MNLSVMLDIFAGGPGSGCHGPNCGHPKTILPAAVPKNVNVHHVGSTRYEIDKYAKRAPTSSTPLAPAGMGIAKYQQSLGTMLKTTGTKWMASPHNYKGYFHVATKGTSFVAHSQVSVLQGPGKGGGGTVVTVTHQMKMLGAPLDRLHVKEQDTDDTGSIYRTRTREFVQVNAGLKQVNNRYGVKL